MFWNNEKIKNHTLSKSLKETRQKVLISTSFAGVLVDKGKLWKRPRPLFQTFGKGWV